MKFYIYANKTNFKEYTLRLIRHLLDAHVVATPDEADYTLLSLCDISEIGNIAAAKRLGRPVITSGMISEYPILNELSNYVWHGEVYGFVRNVRAGQRPDEMASISTARDRRLVIDEEIDWAANPIVRVGRRAMYYYTSKGCPVRCAYCFMANVRRYQKCPRDLYDQAARAAGRNLMPIAAYNPYATPENANISEVLLRNYIKPSYVCTAKMIRSGVEFCDVDNSTALAKGVTIDHLNAALEKSRSEGTKMILYFIAGLESQEQWEDYFARIATDFRTKPAVNVVFTYIDPQPFTPLSNLDISSKIPLDTKRLFAVVTQRNKRFRVLPVATPAKSTVRTLLGRATTERQATVIMKVRNRSNQEILDAVGTAWPELIGSDLVCDVIDRGRRGITPEYWAIAQAQ